MILENFFLFNNNEHITPKKSGMNTLILKLKEKKVNEKNTTNWIPNLDVNSIKINGIEAKIKNVILPIKKYLIIK